MPTDHDVAVVGAGPAGAAAALAAAQRGARTVLLERAQVPRYKRCGGGLIGASQAAVRAAGLDPDRLAADSADRITFTCAGQAGFTRRASAPFLPLVQRSTLDAALVERAVAAGVELRTGVGVTRYVQDATGVTLDTTTGHVRAATVVAADGSGSRAAAHVGVRCDQVDLGMEAELPTPAGADWAGRVLLDWGPVPGSYGWVFPKGDTLTVGVIGARERGAEVRAYYRCFVASLGLDLSRATHDGGHLTRVRAPGSPLVRGRVLLAGDAAGLLEPWTREGISFALRSGALAGAAAVTGPASYPAAVEHALGAEMRAGRRALAAFAAHPRVVHEALRLAPPVWPLLLRVIAGRTDLARQLERRRVRLPVTALAAVRPRTG